VQALRQLRAVGSRRIAILTPARHFVSFANH